MSVVMTVQTVQQKAFEAFTWSQGTTQGIYLLVPFLSCIDAAVLLLCREATYRMKTQPAWAVH